MPSPDGELKSLRTLQAAAKLLPTFNYHTPLGERLGELLSEAESLFEAYRLVEFDRTIGAYPLILKTETANMVVRLMHLASALDCDLQIEIETILNGGVRPEVRAGNVLNAAPSPRTGQPVYYEGDEDEDSLYRPDEDD